MKKHFAGLFIIALVAVAGIFAACSGDDNDAIQTDLDEIAQSLDQMEQDVAAIAALIDLVDDLNLRIADLEAVVNPSDWNDRLITSKSLSSTFDARFSSVSDGNFSPHTALWQHWNLALFHLEKGENDKALSNVEVGLAFAGFVGCGSPKATFNEYTLPSEIRGLINQLAPLYTVEERTGENGYLLYEVTWDEIYPAGC